MNRFLHTNMKSILIGLMISMASFLSPTVATGQTGFWTDEGNYDEGWPEGHIVNDVYEIRDARDLAAFARSINGGTFYSEKTINVVADIDLAAHYWLPIGYQSSVIFNGLFNGLHHTISNTTIDITSLKVDSPNDDFLIIGFFQNNEGSICNVNLHNIQITGTNTHFEYMIGGLVGENRPSNYSGFIDACSISGDKDMLSISLPEEHGDIHIGGISGWHGTYSTIKNCTNRISITYAPKNGKRAYIGGIVGMADGFITGCHNEGDMTAQCTAIGGIVGNAESEAVYGTITDCHNQGDITNLTGASAGGIVGTGSNISHCSNSGNVSSYYKAAGIAGNMPQPSPPVTYCSNSGSISVKVGISDNPSSSTCYCGGIVTDGGTYKISNCYNTGNLSMKPVDGANVNKVYIGGIAASVGGYRVNTQLLSNCYNTGNISVQTPYRCYAGGIIGDGTIGEVSSCYNTGKIDVQSSNNKTVIATGIFKKAVGCLSLAKDKSTPFIRVAGGSNSKVHRLTTYNGDCENNYANAPMLLQIGDQISVATENIAHNDVNGANWQDTDNTSLPISNWPDEAWDKSDNTILPQLKYEDGTLMPDQPQLLKSDYATETPSDPVDPSDATLKSLSYCVGKDDGKVYPVFPVPGFRPDVFYYQISYGKSLTGSPFYVIAEANNPKATVTTVRDDALGRGFVSVSVESEDGKESRTYSIFGVETGDEDKCYLVLNLGSHMGDHMTLELNGKAFRGDAVYKAVPGEQIVGKLVPDKGYRLPGEITEFDGFMMGFIQRGETDMYASDGTIRFTLNGHKLLYASAQEGEEPSSPSDATLKSLSYKIGEDGEVIPVPGFQPDIFHYQISYDKSLTGSAFYAVAEANNPKATVDAGGGDLGKRSALILVESEDKSEGGTYSIFGVESGDEDKRYLVFNLGDHLAFLLNGKEFRGNDVYKGVPGEEIVGKLVPDRGYRLPTEISVHDVFMSSIQRGETDLYTYDGTIHLTLDRGTCIYASAQEGEETDPPSVGSKLTDEPFVYEVLPENRLKLLHPTQSSEEWRVSSCDVPASVRYRGVGYQVTEIGNNAFEDYTNLKIITLSEGLLSIGAFAFDNSGLTRLSLPASVTFIGDEEGDWDLFGDCPNLQAVTVAEGSKTYSASDSILYNKDRSRLILCPPACPHSEVRVPDEVKEIMPYAFAHGKNVSGVTLPAGLVKIGEFAFASSALGKEKSYIRCLGEQPVTFEDTEFLLLLSSTQAEEDHLLASNNGKYPCTLYVPAGTKAAYEAAFFWKNFPIQEELPSGDVTISGGDGKIEVEDENGEKVEVEDGVIGNDDLPTVIERISIDIRASSSETTKLVFKQVTVGDGQVVTQETTTTTEIKEETNVSITIEGENVLGKLVNNGIAALLTGSKDGSLSNTVVVNYNTFTSETKLVSKVEGAAPLDVSDPENKTVVAGGATTLVASTTVESSFNLTFVWERWVDGAWQKVEERKYENLLRSSADKQEDKLTVSAADAGLYRCRITNTVGDASTTLITTPAEVKLTSSGEDPTPTPSETYYDIILPELTGATTNPTAGKHTVKEGDTFSFTLTLDADYDQSKPEVKAGDEVLVADANGKYTIANVRGDLTITITGITLNTPTANAEVEQPVKVWAEGTTLHIYTEKRETIRLYTFSGQLLKQMDNAGRIAITGLPEGNYVIRIGNRTWKIAL